MDISNSYMDTGNKKNLSFQKNNAVYFFVLFFIFTSPIIFTKWYDDVSTVNLLKQFSFDFLLILGLVALCHLLSKFYTKIILVLFTLLIFSLQLIRVIEVSLFDQFGKGFDESFFVHIDPVSFEIALKDFQLFAIFALLLISVLPILFYKLIKKSSALFGNLTSSISLVASVLGLFYLAAPYQALNDYSPSVRFMKEAQSFYSGVKTLSFDEIDKDLLRQLNLPDTYSNRFSATTDGKPKNLILIYLESFDLSFTDFGNSKFKGLTPNIDAFIKKNTILAQNQGTERFTIAGIISSQCGLTPPMHKGNDSLFGSDYFEGIICLSDVLNQVGYQQEYFGGANKKFAGKVDFLKSHHYDEVYGMSDFEHKEKYKAYRASWGLYDQSLFEEAYARIEQLAAKDQPYNVTLLTLNTHIPGVRSPNCPKYKGHSEDHSFLNAIHCSDHDFGNFIKKLEKNKILDDALLVLTSDHFVFRTRTIKALFGTQLEDQRIVTAIRSPNKTLAPEITVPTGIYDLAPTILELLDIDISTPFLLGKSAISLGERSLIVDRHDKKVKNIENCSQENNEFLSNPACKAKIIVELQDYVIHKSQNPLDNNQNFCNVVSDLKIRSSNEKSVPSHVILGSKNVLDSKGVLDVVLDKVWPVTSVNRKNREGIYFLTINGNGNVDKFKFIGVKDTSSSKQFLNQISNLPEGKLNIIFARGDVSTVFNPSVSLFIKNLGIDSVSKISGDNPFFVLIFDNGSLNRYEVFQANQENFVELEMTKSLCNALTASF